MEVPNGGTIESETASVVRLGFRMPERTGLGEKPASTSHFEDLLAAGRGSGPRNDGKRGRVGPGAECNPVRRTGLLVLAAVLGAVAQLAADVRLGPVLTQDLVHVDAARRIGLAAQD